MVIQKLVKDWTPILIKYSLVGIINTSLCIAIMLLFEFLGTSYIVYTLIAYTISFLVSFVLNLRFTFKVNGDIRKRLTLFVFIGLFNLIWVEWLQILLIDYYHYSQLFSIGLGIFLYSAVGFVMNQRFVFNRITTAAKLNVV